jgi:hypothetical protein
MILRTFKQRNGVVGVAVVVKANDSEESKNCKA